MNYLVNGLNSSCGRRHGSVVSNRRTNYFSGEPILLVEENKSSLYTRLIEKFNFIRDYLSIRFLG